MVSSASWIAVSVGPSLDDVPSGKEEEEHHLPFSLKKHNTLWVHSANLKWPRAQVQVHYDFVERERSALQQMSQASEAWEGFDGPRRRVQQYTLDDATAEGNPPVLQSLQERLLHQTGLSTRFVKVEDYVPTRYANSWKYDPQMLSTCAIPARFHENFFFVAEIILPLPSPSDDASVSPSGEVPNHHSNHCWIQNWNLPRDHDQGFHLQSEHHSTFVRLPYYALMVRTEDMVASWRNSRWYYSPPEAGENEDPPPRIRVVQFYSHAPSSVAKNVSTNVDRFGYVRKYPDDALVEEARRATVLPPLADLLTIVITTSPIKSHPSTEVLEKALDTLLLGGGPEFAYACRKVIVCDGHRTYQANKQEDDPTTTISRRQNDKQSLRNGIATPEQAQNYTQYKERLRALCQNAPSDSVFQNTEILELTERHGYGFALKHAVSQITTPYVCVIQHDRTFVRPAPIRETVHAMYCHLPIKYVGFSMRSNLLYRDIFLAKYGKQYQSEWDDMILRVPELHVPSDQYGPQSASTAALQVKNERVRQNIQALTETYHKSAQASIAPAAKDGLYQISLVPTLYWYDNIHICATEHYRDFVFDARLKMCARGGFVEDKLSPVLKRTVERLGLRPGHERFGCYLLDDHSGMFFTGHLDGGSYLSASERAALLTTDQSDPIDEI